MRLDLITIVVHEYDPAIDFFVNTLGLEHTEDVPASAVYGYGWSDT